MRLALAAIVVLLIAFVAVYAATRNLPGPNPPPGPCGAAGAGCPPPQTCVGGVCVDSALGGLIKAAQAPASALYSGLAELSAAFQLAYGPHVAGLSAAAAAAGLPTPDPSGLQKNLADGAADLAKLLHFYRAPGCDPTKSVACGYCAQIAALTPTTPGGIIISVAAASRAAAGQLLGGLGSVPAVASGIANLMATVQSEITARGMSIVQLPGILMWMNVLSADVQALNTAASSSGPLATAAADMARTGYDLYSHMLGGGSS